MFFLFILLTTQRRFFSCNCSFLYCSTDRSKAVVPVLVLLFVALWFIIRGDLLYVFPCVILFLCFSVLLVLRLPRLGKRELILVLFVRLFGLCLFRFVGFLFLLGSGKGWDCDCGTPCSYLFFHMLHLSCHCVFLVSSSFSVSRHDIYWVTSLMLYLTFIKGTPMLITQIAFEYPIGTFRHLIYY